MWIAMCKLLSFHNILLSMKISMNPEACCLTENAFSCQWDIKMLEKNKLPTTQKAKYVR
jgi:hypothetical protein